jgi:hypothetical protein
MNVVLADGRVHKTGAHALSERAVPWTGDGGPYLSQWYLGARDSMGIVAKAFIYMFPMNPGRTALAFSFSELSPALEAMKEISRRNYCREAFVANRAGLAALGDGAPKPGEGAGWTLVIGIESFPELAALNAERSKTIARKNSGKVIEDGVNTDFLDSPHFANGETTLPFFCTFSKAESFLETMKKQGGDAKDPALVLVSMGMGHTLSVLPIWPENDAGKEALDRTLDTLYEQGAFFDMLPYELSRKLYRKNEALFSHVMRMKKMMDPENLLNPHEFGAEA